MSATQVVDLAIIGSGSGNSIPDERFADTTIAIFEEACTAAPASTSAASPTKMFVYAAEVAEIAEQGARLGGVHAKVDSVDWPGIVERVFGRIDPISEGGKEYRVDRCENITVYSSHVEFDGRDEDGLYLLVTADGATVLAREVVLAAGSRAVIPPAIAESGGVKYYTNNDVMRLPELPERLVIVGSGYIAAEFAHVFGALGSRVSIIARGGPALLRKQDADISNRFTQVARDKWDVHLDTGISGAEDLPDGGVRLHLADGSDLEADVLLVATGRKPNGDRLNLSSVGIELDEEGGGCVATPTVAPPRAGGCGLSVTSVRRTSSSTSPTTRSAWCRPTC